MPLRICANPQCRRSYTPRRPGVYRCEDCQGALESERNAARPQYGPGWERLSREVIEAEPWCHYPGGCHHRDAGTAANPLTCEHILPVAMGGTNDRSNLTVLCRRHNSSGGGRTRRRR